MEGGPGVQTEPLRQAQDSTGGALLKLREVEVLWMLTGLGRDVLSGACTYVRTVVDNLQVYSSMFLRGHRGAEPEQEQGEGAAW